MISYTHEPGFLFNFISTALSPDSDVLTYLPKQLSKGLKNIIGFLEKDAKASEKFWNPDHPKYKPKVELVTAEILKQIQNTQNTLNAYASIGSELVPEFVSF